MAGAGQWLEDTIAEVLRTPGDAGFAALAPDGATKTGLSEQVLAAMAREALTRGVPGVTFNEITAHSDEHGQLMRIEIDYMDEIHDPSSQRTIVSFEPANRAHESDRQ